jgi:hypothetical protein
MLAIRIQINHRNIILMEGDRQDIGVRRRNGEYQYLPWAGFADIELAKRAGKAVQCLASAYTLNNAGRVKWIECDHLQGCLLKMGGSLSYKVFVVTRDGVPVDISRQLLLIKSSRGQRRE